jgi:hypothetical protein
VLDLRGIVSVGACQRQSHADLRDLLLGLHGRDAACTRQGYTSYSGNIEGTTRMLGLLHDHPLVDVPNPACSRRGLAAAITSFEGNKRANGQE